MQGETRSSTQSDRSVLALVLALWALWLPGLLGAGFLMDDRELIFDNPLVAGDLPWTEAFARDYFHHAGDAGAWRPLASLSLRLDHALFGSEPLGYHITNGLLHLGVLLALGLLLAPRVPSRLALAGGLACFGLHPALGDSVFWISGRTSQLSCLAPLWAAVLLDRGRLAPLGAALVAGLGLGVGLSGKEDALVLAPLLFALAPAGRRARLSVAGALALAGGLVFCARWRALGGPFISASTPAMPGADFLERAELGGLATWEALRLAWAPFDFPPQYTAALLVERARPLTAGVAAALGWLLWSALWLPLGVCLALKRRAPLPAWAAAAVAFSWLPVAQIVPLGEVFAARFLYLPLLAAAPLSALAIARLTDTRLRAAVVALLIAALFGGLQVRAKIYDSRGAWRQEQLRHDPGDGASWNNLGLWFEELNELPRARDAWRQGTAVAPRYSKNWSNLGRVALAAGEIERAREAWQRALLEGPQNPVAHVNLAGLLLREGHTGRALELYERAVSLAPGLAPAWLGLALARQSAGQTLGAEAAVNRALDLDPSNPGARLLLAELWRTP